MKYESFSKNIFAFQKPLVRRDRECRSACRQCERSVKLSPHETSNRAVGPREWTEEEEKRNANIECSIA